MFEPVRIAVIDDHPLFRDAVVGTLSAVPELDVISVGASASDAIRIAQQESPDVMLLDIHMPGSGIEATKEILRTCPVIEIVMHTVSESADDLVAALEAGARGYVLKGVSGPDLVRSVLAVHNGEFYVTPTLAARLLSRMRQISPQSEKINLDVSADLTSLEEEALILPSWSTNNERARKLH